jgi:glycopeptide antibiotics resistance protein
LDYQRLFLIGIPAACAVAAMVGIVGYVVLFKFGKKPPSLRQLVPQCALLAWAFVFALILQFAYYPIYTSFNLAPFQFLTGSFSAGLLANQFLYNALLFLPFGMLFPMAFPKFRIWWMVAAVAFLLSIMAELVQFALGGSGDVDDVIARVMGAVAGMIVFVVVKRTCSRASSLGSVTNSESGSTVQRCNRRLRKSRESASCLVCCPVIRGGMAGLIRGILCVAGHSV